MYFKEYVYSTTPTEGIIAAGEAAIVLSGHCAGNQALKVTSKRLSALENGKQLADENNEGENDLFMGKEPDAEENRELWRTFKYWVGRTPPPAYFLHPVIDQGDYKRPVIDYQQLSAYMKRTKKTPAELTYDEIQ